MTRATPRTNFHSSHLIRCLVDLAVVEAVEPDNSFAEKLSQWIHFTDAIKLSAVHNDGSANSATALATAAADTRAAVDLEFDRVQATLTNSIRKSCTPALGKSHIPLPAPILALPLHLATAYSPYHRFYNAHQRDMELSVRPLRTNVREALAKTSPALKRLADMDAVLETILHERERKLLGKVPLLLKKRFEHFFKAHQQRLIDSQQADHPAGWTQPGAWLALFHNDLQILLLAELELRLQPSQGLLESLNNELINA